MLRVLIMLRWLVPDPSGLAGVTIRRNIMVRRGAAGMIGTPNLYGGTIMFDELHSSFPHSSPSTRPRRWPSSGSDTFTISGKSALVDAPCAAGPTPSSTLSGFWIYKRATGSVIPRIDGCSGDLVHEFERAIRCDRAASTKARKQFASSGDPVAAFSGLARRT